jgi:hypothetical protein
MANDEQDLKLIEAMISAFTLLPMERQDECILKFLALKKTDTIFPYPPGFTYPPGQYWVNPGVGLNPWTNAQPQNPYLPLTTGGGVNTSGASTISPHPKATGLYDI